MKKLIISLLTVLIIFPVLLACSMHFDVFSKALGNADGWLSYWGGYLGALIGAVTVYIVTNLQINEQRMQHKEALEAQTELHKSNLTEQRKLQMESIRESSHQSDLRERDLLITNMRISKVENIIYELIKIKGVNQERLNILRTYNQYNHYRKKWNFIIAREKFFNKYRGVFKNTVNQTPKSFLISKRRLKKSILKRVPLSEANIKLEYYHGLCDELLEKETDKRNEITIISAKIKSEALIADLDDELDKFRGYQENLLSIFYKIVTEDKISEKAFYHITDEHGDLIISHVNSAIKICHKKLTYELSAFRKQE